MRDRDSEGEHDECKNEMEVEWFGEVNVMEIESVRVSRRTGCLLIG